MIPRELAYIIRDLNKEKRYLVDNQDDKDEVEVWSKRISYFQDNLKRALKKYKNKIHEQDYDWLKKLTTEKTEDIIDRYWKKKFNMKED